ncbi:MAG: sulfatase-like hydrolase/transferase [Candidatus Nanosalina sp.]
MSEFKNVFIFVSDALGYRHTPEKLVEEAESPLIKGLCPSPNSAKSFSSMFTALEVSNHSVDHFGDVMEQDHVFELFENSNLWDAENSAVRYIFQLEDNPDLDEMDEPFFWAERSLETHTPYGKVGHDKEYDEEELEDWKTEGRYYATGQDDEKVRKDYAEAVEKSYRHFKRHVEYLKDNDLYEDTLVIFTADHGEALGERIWGRKRYEHGRPAHHLVAEVPIIFYNHEVNVEKMRTIDILPTALNLLDREWLLDDVDGVNILEHEVTEGECPTGPYIFDLEWRWNDRKKVWQPKPFSLVKALIEDYTPEKVLRKLGFDRKKIKFDGNNSEEVEKV